MTEPREESSTDLEQALAAYLAAQRMTRRQLLERIAAVGAAAALAPVIAACVAGPEDPSRTVTSAVPHTAPPTLSAAPPALPAGSLVAAEAAPATPVQAAAARSHVIARILARILARG